MAATHATAPATMTRNQAREAFQDSGLDYAILTRSNLARLRKLIDLEMRNSRLFNDTFRAPRAAVLKSTANDLTYAYINCTSDYFTKRQAVSFEESGFIGFAGWADNQNVQPVLAGFIAWLDEMIGQSKTGLQVTIK